MNPANSSLENEGQSQGAGPLRLMFFMNTIVRGGAEEHVLTLLRGLSRKYFQLSFVCPPILADEMSADLPSDVKLFPLRLRGLRDVAAAARFAAILRRERVDIVHSHLFYSSLFASPVAWACGTPLILETGHGREHWRNGIVTSKFFVDRIAGRFVDGYIAVSEATGRYLQADKGLPGHKISVIQNGCDLNRFAVTADSSRLRTSLEITDDEVVLVVPGRLEPQKGHRFLLQAMPLIQQRFPKTRLVCVGDGSLRTALEQMATGLRLTKPVLFVGYQSKIQDWYALADVIVMPSLYEGLPLVAIEALAASRPVVATAVDGTSEVIIDGRTGLSVPSQDPEALAHAICTLLSDSALRERVAKTGHDWVWEKFTQERQIAQTQDYYLAQWAMHGCKSCAPNEEQSRNSATNPALDI